MFGNGLQRKAAHTLGLMIEDLMIEAKPRPQSITPIHLCINNHNIDQLITIIKRHKERERLNKRKIKGIITNQPNQIPIEFNHMHSILCRKKVH